MTNDEIIRIFVGADRSQMLAVSVLEHSIKRHTTATVEVIPMVDLPVPVPRNPANWQRTGFSFSRFCIPKLAGYRGRAIYMDADMQVFKDIRELWGIPFGPAKVLVQEQVKFTDITLQKTNAPATRKKQCAVMLLDCSRLDWKIDDIVQELDAGKYTYEQLMDFICILPEAEVGYSIPFEWNSLEHFDNDTRLIHYTDMGTQPWVSTRNPLGHLWFEEVRLMLANGKLTRSAIQKEIDSGYFRPSLIRDITFGHKIPAPLLPFFNRFNQLLDWLGGYKPHKAVYAAKQLRVKALQQETAP